MKSIQIIAILIALGPSLGFSAEQLINIDDQTSVRMAVFTPQNSGDGPWPLAMLIPAGSGQEFVIRSQFWLGKELTERGWIIAVPLSYDGDSFFGDGNLYIDKVVSQLQQDPIIKSGKTLLLGVSQGGTSALDIASRNPSQYYGVVAVPGRLRESETLPPLDGLPVFLRIADRDDFRWHKQLTQISERLESAGAIVNASLVPNARHIFRIDWDELDPWLKSLK
jgi:pimeloyl-ACP methyl ester carboxylesterase